MSEKTCTIGIDMGTTTLKAVAFADEDGSKIARARDNVDLVTDETGTAEQDAEALYDGLTAVVAEVVAEAGRSGHRVAGLGVSAAMHSLLLVGKDDRPLSNAIIWMDTRAEAEAKALWETDEGKAVYARTGTPVHPMAPLVKLVWLKKEKPGLFARAARFVSLKEWIWHGWFGEWQVDASIASATGLYNLEERDWDRKALTLAGIRADQLSKIVEPRYFRTDLKEKRLIEAGLVSDTPFVIGASDGVLANLGVGATGPDRLVLTIGTSLAARFGSTRAVTDPASRSFCYVLDRDRFIVGGPSNSGGILLDWLYHKVLRPPHVTGEDLLGAVIESAAKVETGELTCLPYLTGERAPLWDASARAAFVGLGINHGREHLMRAAVEGIVFNARWLVEGLFEKLGRPKEVIGTGRPFEDGWIRQLTADIFDMPVRHYSDIDPSVMGAAMIAHVATGVAEREGRGLFDRLGDGKVTTPSRAQAYQAKYRRFRHLAALAAETGEKVAAHAQDMKEASLPI
ncbi:MAG: gluconokinase [Rhizobiales bacterium]|nr:gluconokinase [Hyphomicrobiales bacterium]